jgi:hypothetical protein
MARQVYAPSTRPMSIFCQRMMVRLVTIGALVVLTLAVPSFSFVCPKRKIDYSRTGQASCRTGRHKPSRGGRQLGHPKSKIASLFAGPPQRNDGRNEDGITVDEIKRQLTEYLEKRREVNADRAAEEARGRVVGGTRGNAILEYVSGAPVRERVIDGAPNVFDYDELARYGYPHLVTPIMDLVGGRRAVYELMGMDPPPLLGPPPRRAAPRLVIDRTGAEDKARYSGLKMGQVLDDSAMAEALERANRIAREGKELRPKLMEEDYVKPFAGEGLGGAALPWCNDWP